MRGTQRKGRNPGENKRVISSGYINFDAGFQNSFSIVGVKA